MSLLILWIETHMQAHLNKLVTWFSIFLLHHTSRDKKTSYFSCFSAAEKSVFFFLLAFFLSFLWLGYTSAIFSPFLTPHPLCLFFREEKSEQLLDTRQELENMEGELKRLQQEVTPRVNSDHHTPTCTQHTNTPITSSLPHLPLLPLSKYFVSAALPGFNQQASDLAH